MPFTHQPGDFNRATQEERPDPLTGVFGEASPWLPLSHPLYRSLWVAGIASNTGAYMQDVAAVWSLTEISASPFIISLKQAVTSLPMVLLALPAGAMADTMDRRRLLLWAQAGGLVSVAALALLGWMGMLTPLLLLLLTFTLAMATAVYTPTAQASLSEWVPRVEVPRGVTLNNVSVSLGRAAGPVLGGLLVAQVGAWAVFALNALTFVATWLIVLGWKREGPLATLPPEPIRGAMATGVRYLKNAPALRITITRAAILLLPASALWTLLPVRLREELALGPVAFGGVFGAVGVGAVAGAALLPRLRKSHPTDRLVGSAAAVLGGALLLLPHMQSYPALLLAGFLAGLAWICAVPLLAAAAGAGAPGWFKGRALATFTLVSQLAAVIGSFLWGLVAVEWSTAVAFQAAAALLVLGLPAARWLPLARGECLDLSPSGTRPRPNVAPEMEVDHGAVMIQVSYTIDPEQAVPFRQAMEAVRLERHREGATFWGLFQVAEEPRRYVEVFLVESWLDHLRAHERVTVSDRDVESHALAFHRGSDLPQVSHFVARHLPARGVRPS